MLVRPHQVKSILFQVSETWRKDTCHFIEITYTTWKYSFKNIPEFDKTVNALDFLPIVAGIGAFLMTWPRSQHWCFIWCWNHTRLILIFKIINELRKIRPRGTSGPDGDIGLILLALVADGLSASVSEGFMTVFKNNSLLLNLKILLQYY